MILALQQQAHRILNGCEDFSNNSCCITDQVNIEYYDVNSLFLGGELGIFGAKIGLFDIGNGTVYGYQLCKGERTLHPSLKLVLVNNYLLKSERKC
jgi:hypothetical protein